MLGERPDAARPPRRSPSEMLATAGRQRRRRRTRSRAIRGDPAPRAVPDRRRRPVRRDRRRRGRRRRCPGSPTRRSRRRSRSPAARSREQRGLDEAPTRMAIVAMGRYGGYELSYGSDADVMFVHDPLPGADPQEASTYAQRGGQRAAPAARRCPARDPALEVDADLRPEGKQGPLVRTLESYAAYYAKWSAVWEAQALLRADAVVGDADLRRRFTELIDPLRFPADGLTERRRGRGPPDQGAGRRRAAAARRRPAHPPQARPRRAGRRRVDGPAAADAARRRASPALRTTATLDALAAAARGRPARRARTPTWLAARLAHGQPGAQRGHPGARQARRPAAPRRPRAGGGRQRSWATRPARPTRWSTTTCAPPGGPGRSSTGSSGAERRRDVRRRETLGEPWNNPQPWTGQRRGPCSGAVRPCSRPWPSSPGSWATSPPTACCRPRSCCSGCSHSASPSAPPS